MNAGMPWKVTASTAALLYRRASTARVAISGRTATATTSTAPAARMTARAGDDPAMNPSVVVPTVMAIAARGPGSGWSRDE
jgi:hypothetical protein